MFINADIFDVLKETYGNCFNTIFCDPPYNFSTRWKIESSGKVISENESDILDQWEGLGADGLEILFKQFYRVLKHGGYCILYGVDRQLFAFQYFALKAGFEICQSLYWYFTSGYPKSENVARKIDKKFNEKGNLIRERRAHKISGEKYLQGAIEGKKSEPFIYREFDVNTNLAKTFKGYQFGIAPFKPVLETIMVFRKPSKTKPFEDIMDSLEDFSISPAVVNVKDTKIVKNKTKGEYFPSQMYMEKNTSETFEKMDKNAKTEMVSKIDYFDEELPLLFAESKASLKERELGLEKFEGGKKKGFNTSPREYSGEVKGEVHRKNTHPTVKPIQLNTRIFSRFKLPKIFNQKVFIPFSGVGSEYIGVMNNKINEDNIVAVEINENFYNISLARRDYYKDLAKKNPSLF